MEKNRVKLKIDLSDEVTMYGDPLAGLIGHEVEAVANGISYRGKLIEVSETEVFIQGEMGWMQLQVEEVTEIKPV